MASTSVTDAAIAGPKYKELCAGYKASLLGAAHDLLHDQEQAQQAVEMALKKVSKYMDDIDEVDSDVTRAFLFILLRGSAAALDSNVTAEAEAAGYGFRPGESGEGEEEDEMGDEAAQQAMNRTLAGMSPVCADVVMLQYVYGYSPYEMADLLHTKKEDITLRQYRATEMLKEALPMGRADSRSRDSKVFEGLVSEAATRLVPLRARMLPQDRDVVQPPPVPESMEEKVSLLQRSHSLAQRLRDSGGALERALIIALAAVLAVGLIWVGYFFLRDPIVEYFETRNLPQVEGVLKELPVDFQRVVPSYLPEGMEAAGISNEKTNFTVTYSGGGHSFTYYVDFNMDVTRIETEGADLNRLYINGNPAFSLEREDSVTVELLAKGVRYSLEGDISLEEAKLVLESVKVAKKK